MTVSVALFLVLGAQVETSTTPEAILQRLEDVEQRTRIIERKEEIEREKAAEAAKNAKPPSLISAEAGKGITISNGDGSLSMNIVGRVVPRETLLVLRHKWTNDLSIRTARLNLSGTVLTP